MKIFLSYRTADMDGQAPFYVGKIFQRFSQNYGAGNIIMDMNIVPPGARFDGYVKGMVGQADVVVVIIGPQWAELMRHRAKEAQDFVRAEVEAALLLDLPIVPVVVDDTVMPTPSDLPESVEGITGKQRFRLTSGAELNSQLGRLIHHIDAAVVAIPGAKAVGPAISVRPHREVKPKNRGQTSMIAWLGGTIIAATVILTIATAYKLPAHKQVPERPDRDPTNDYLNTIGDRMVWCLPGTFLMGSPETEVGHSKDEMQHQVTLTQGFWIGAHEITQAQWKLVMGAEHESYSDAMGTDVPVTQVTWGDAVEFCNKLSQREKRNYQLPTEAQWEYACRAGTTGPNNVEGLDLNLLAWHEGNSDGKLHLTGQKSRNYWGLQDMHGNVFEWCQDWYHEFGSEPATDPKGPETGEFRVYRGSAFDIGNPYHRSAYRSWNKPDHKAPNLGLRIVALPQTRPGGAAPTTAGTAKPEGPAGPISTRDEVIAPETKVRFIFCPPGKFIMGEGTAAREVTLTEGFWLGETEISRGQWKAVMGKGQDVPNRGLRVPVDQVGWDDIAGRAGFLAKIQSKAPPGWQFALPTEAQWEYACRAGTSTAYSWGDQFVDGKANVANAPGTAESQQTGYFESKGLPTGSTMAVKSLGANPWGFYDMHGNVWEWCQDWFEEPPSSSSTDPQGAASGDLKLLKGGSWSDAESQAKSAARLRYFPTFQGKSFGFRLALIPKP